MRNCVLSVAAVCLAAVPALAQSTKEVTGPLTMTPEMVACTDLPVATKPVPHLVVKDVHDPEPRLSSFPGRMVAIGRSADDGLAPGQRYTVSRVQNEKLARAGEGYSAFRTTGVIRIWAVNEWNALAVVEASCETIEAGYHLSPYVETSLPSSAAAMLDPDFDDRAHVLFGKDTRELVGDGDVVSIDRGA